MADNQIYTLSEGVDEYLALRQISKKKYYASYLISAKFAWRRIFKNTIYAANSQWFTVQKGTPYNYVDKPKGCSLFLSASVVDDCGRIQELFYDNQVNIIPKPLSSQKKCGCSCDCGGMCDDVNSMTYTTRVLFSVNGKDYFEKTWLKTCPNGDVIEYRIVPTKKYNDYTGDSGGDYNDDYNNDYSHGAPDNFSNYTIEYPEFQKIICKLSVKECGCPDDTAENIDTLNEYCGIYLSANSCCKKKQCDNFLGEINGSARGTVKFSECGTKIYYIPDDNGKGTPEFLLLNWMTNGETCGEYVQVPDYAIPALFAGIDFYSKRFNNAYNQTEKDNSKYAFNAAENEVILDLNRLSLKWLSGVQDAEIKY